ncbi:MAG: hypothetical protein R2836_08370 [Chitinophagales bacterium]
MLTFSANNKILFISTLIVALLCFSTAKAQNVNVSSGIKLTNKAPKFRIAGKLNNRYLAERYKDNYHILDVYNGYLKLQSSKTIPIQSNEYIKKLWINPQQSWLIKLNHSNNYSTINALQLDDKIRFADKPIVIDTLREKSDLLNNNLRTQLSLDENLILFYTPIFENGSIKSFYTKVVNNKLETVASKYLTDNYLINQYFVDVFLLNDGSYVFITTNDRESDNADYFITYIKNGQVKTSVYNPIQDVFKKIEFEIDYKTNSLIASGFYREPKENKRDNTGASKLFVTKIDLNNFETTYTDIVPITESFYNKLTGKASETTPPQLYTFYINNIIPKNDGGCLVLAESYFKNEEESLNNYYFSVSGMNTYSSSTIYNFNDILVYNVDSNGIIDKENIGIIRKKQISTNDNGSYSSFYTANLQNELQLIYLDEIDNEGQLLAESIEPHEDSKNKVVMNIGGNEVVPIVKMSMQTAPNEILIPSMSRSKFKLIKLVF